MSEERKITSINGVQYAQVLAAGARWLSDREKQLDDINLFPVPDADTGTNMGGTVILLAEDPESFHADTISDASRRVADATLVSAKGNSGAILAQFFQGLSEGLESYKTATVPQFASAVKIAAKRSREAVSNPKEGTILTVIDDWSRHLSDPNQQQDDFVSQFRQSLNVAEESLQRTKEQMEIFKKANVVDAGAQGFVYFLEGIVNYIAHGSIQRDRWKKATTNPDTSFQQDFDFEGSKFRFCTEALVSGAQIDKEAIRSALSPLGDSLVVIGSQHKIRIHIHTNTPGSVYDILRSHGKVIQEKIDDMEQQKIDVFGKISRDIALITDTSCDLPESVIQQYNIHRIPFQINLGGITHYDERTLSNEEFYQYMRDHVEPPKTSQLTKGDLKRMFEWTNRNFQHSILLVLARPISGSIDNATAVAQEISPNIYPVDSHSVSAGTGLLAIQTARAIDEGKNIHEVLSIIEACKASMYQVFTVDNLVYLMRGGRLSKGKMRIGNMLHMKPILFVEKDGSLHQFGTALGGDKGVRRKLMKKIKDLTKDRSGLNFCISHAVCEQRALWYKEQIEKNLCPKSVTITALSSTVGTHSGPGTIAIAWMPDYEELSS